MIDKKSLKEHTRFIIQHYGTCTQGEDYRYDQVAEHLTEMFMQLVIVNEAIGHVMKDMNITTIFSIKVG